MSIRFRCEACDKTVEAPDAAAGKPGKCPYCGHSAYIPAPMRDEDIIPFSPIDEEGPEAADPEAARLRDLEKELLHEMSGEPEVPLEHKEDLGSGDLHHYVVNYCMDMFRGGLERAELTAKQLKQYKFTAIEAVQDFRAGKASEAALKSIPPKVLKGFLDGLLDKLRH